MCIIIIIIIIIIITLSLTSLGLSDLRDTEQEMQGGLQQYMWNK